MIPKGCAECQRMGPRRALTSRALRRPVVVGDGVRLGQFNFARPLAVAGFLTLAAVVSVMGAPVGDWLQLRQLTRESVPFAAQIAGQRKTIADFNRRVAELRKEVGAWHEMHARIQEPFGPEVGRGARERGIGGATTPSGRPAGGISASDELNRLAATIIQEGEELRALLRLVTRPWEASGPLASPAPRSWA